MHDEDRPLTQVVDARKGGELMVNAIEIQRRSCSKRIGEQIGGLVGIDLIQIVSMR
jgi:hypothetical protein